MFSAPKVQNVFMWVVGLGIIIYNAVFGNQDLVTFTTGLMLCGIPTVFKLDKLIKVLPKVIAKSQETPDPPVLEKDATKESSP